MELRTLRYFVAVAEELHFGRAATRLFMSQPPLSRAIRQLETDLGTTLFNRSASGVSLTPAGSALLVDARRLLAQADRVRSRVAAAAGAASLTVGILGNSTDPDIARLAAAYRSRHPNVEVHIRETDLDDPTCGLRAGLVDIALTRGPFDYSGLQTYELRSDPVGVVLRSDDPLATRESLTLADLSDRRWFQFPPGTDPIWQSYWNGGQPRQGPVVRAVQECLQSVLWNGTIGLTPLPHPNPGPQLTTVPLTDLPPTPALIAWTDSTPLTLSFLQTAKPIYR
ncbi:LysR substrate-binding domain-containing protein [Kribbella jejuensis]|uniref:DNA-binding transcriptional LysR family regulator n=1 Tax=Kribbella jejuensis TaxID=236068 RepID=A0A542DTH7_9ACTN|nr:LysR substrate-binding domain-containing protein [Kribbella jejuensis]TQJ06397.1 DNA-binding transcriptional LysR family regulator [Kribbella jejuensis]